MKTLLRNLFSPILNYFESGEDEFNYKNSHRTILLVVGALFTFLACAIVIAGLKFSQMGAILPGLIFISVGSVCFIVGFLGSDRAVAKIWGSK
jgi:hypothetical protein